VRDNRDNLKLAGGLWKDIMMRNENACAGGRACLLMSVYATCHILNASTNDLQIPIEELGLSVLEVWNGLDVLLNYDRQMPSVLRMILLNHENSFISHRLWQDNVLVADLR
jgi:hypothetical protein